MLTYQQGERLATAWVEICIEGRGALMLEHTITRPSYWVFFYQSRAYIETGDDRELFLGNAPIIVDRVNGEIFVTGTAQRIEKYLAAYEATLPPARLKMKPEPPAA